MSNAIIRQQRRDRRKRGLRKRIFGVPARPRLSIFRSQKHIYAQIIDDLAGRTLASASTTEKSFADQSSTSNTSAAAVVGKEIAARAKAAGISAVVFDRNGFRYHGRVKAIAEAAREGGLQF